MADIGSNAVTRALVFLTLWLAGLAYAAWFLEAL